ncbi:MAG: hypothetical protein QOE61_142, partial [Micromonosporaceae bacterium]|nr:hypothetical protein [Micromonosporaceae bacterium]
MDSCSNVSARMRSDREVRPSRPDSEEIQLDARVIAVASAKTFRLTQTAKSQVV